ncbi:MAG TPA: AtpZ/AtpI family protein [Candidatus Acidoferrales bacterium]|nr:AtpZ/AtpI family protein [Candidatus Acidoferrales bacterium]
MSKFNDSQGRNSTPPLVRTAKYIAVGIEFPSTVLAGLIVGYYLDEHFTTSPWLLFACTMLALMAAFWRLVQVLRRFSGERR